MLACASYTPDKSGVKTDRSQIRYALQNMSNIGMITNTIS